MVELTSRAGPAEVAAELTRRVNDNIRRIRMVEERLRNLDARVNNLDQSLLNETKNINRQIAENSEAVRLIQDRLANIENGLATATREIKRLVTRSEIKEIENYVELIKPITTKFVTHGEVKEMIKASIEEQAEVRG